MLCPTCRTTLKQSDYEGILVETCDKCSGIWLDDGELGHVAAARERIYDPKTRHALAMATPIQGVVLAKIDRQLKCPKCDEVTKAINYGGDTGIIIDRCTQCGGSWMDGGELEKIEMLVEGWEDELPRDLKRYGRELRMIEERYEGEPSGSSSGVSGFVNAIIEGVFRFQ